MSWVNYDLSNEHSLDQEPPGTLLQIYGFFENFFRSKERAEKVTSGSANDIDLEYPF